jgi:hypothetical protein
MVKAKFKCDLKIEMTEGFYLEFSPVIEGSPENKEFFKYTPSGKLTMATINILAATQFETGKEYYLYLSPAN